METSETGKHDPLGGRVETRTRAKRENIQEQNRQIHRWKEQRADNQEAGDSATISGSNHHIMTQSENRAATDGPDHTDIKEEETFKSWLTARIMDGLNTAAGATLSTTGQLIAPPLHVTKTVILPSLLSLFVDTLDTVTPQRLKDWFRILSSSIHHLVSVIRSTKGGKQFSSRFIDVTQDFALVASAPETRNILIDTMAFGVKVLDALNTKEARIMMDHITLLACRIVDVAASGKTKQLFHSMNGMIQDGVEMGSDPAATLAFAEVTAHLCYALEDIHSTLEPHSRLVRNKHNRETYLSTLEVSDLQSQPSVEEVILSCLGRLDRSETNSTDLPRQREPNDLPNLKNRVETVDINYLRNNVCFDSASTALPTEPVHRSNESCDEQMSSSADDIEDFKERGENWQKEEPNNSRQDAIYQTITEPPVRQFYEILDTFLEKNRRGCERADFTPSLYNNPLRRVRDDGTQAEILRAKVQKLKRSLKSTAKTKENKGSSHSRSRHPRMISVAGSVFILALVVLWFGFGAYGAYSLVHTYFLNKGHGTRNDAAEQSDTQQSEIVLRIIREVRHVNANENEAPHAIFSTEQELDAVAGCISSRLETGDEQ